MTPVQSSSVPSGAPGNAMAGPRSRATSDLFFSKTVVDLGDVTSGNGSTDDSDNLLRALSRGGVFFWPGGNYRITRDITVPSYTTILFDANAELLVDADCNGLTNQDWINGNTGIRIVGGKVNGQKAQRTAGGQFRGLYLVNCADVWVDGFVAHDTEDHGIMYSGCNRAHLENAHAYNCGLNNTTVGGSGIAIAILADGQVVTLDSCYAYNNFRAGFRNAISTGVQVLAGYSCSDSHAWGNGADGGSGGFSWQGGGAATPTKGGSFNGCTSFNNLQGDGFRITGGVRGLELNGCKGIGNGQHGVRCLQAVVDCNINGGYYMNNSQQAANTYNGIQFEDTGSACTGNIVKGARCGDDQGAPTQKYGISEANNTNYNTYTGNDLRGNNTGPTNIIGKRTRSESNMLLQTGIPTIASSATLDLANGGEVVRITGSVAITAINASWQQRRVTLKFDSACTLTNSANLMLAGAVNFNATADDQITLVCDGTIWREEGRSVN